MSIDKIQPPVSEKDTSDEVEAMRDDTIHRNYVSKSSGDTTFVVNHANSLNPPILHGSRPKADFPKLIDLSYELIDEQIKKLDRLISALAKQKEEFEKYRDEFKEDK